MTTQTQNQTQTQAQALLDKAEELDGYVAACRLSPPNAAARRLCEYFAWNDQSEANALNDLYAGAGIQFVTMSPSTEGGMPHTRPPNLICIPAYWPQERLQETIRHELVHISQRRNPQEWHSRLTAAGWAPVPVAALPPMWVIRCRLNPDTFHSPFWAWQGRHVPLPLFEREDKPKLKEISVRWWDLDAERLNNQPSSFTQTYGHLDPSSAEHPYELVAYNPVN